MTKLELLLGNALDVLPSLPKQDCFVFSPPYNIGIKYGTYRDKQQNFGALMAPIFCSIAKRLKKSGHVFMNTGSQNSDPFFSYRMAELMSRYLVLQNHIVWCKSISIEDKSVGHYKPCNSPRYLNNLYEDVWHFTKDGNQPVDKLAIGVPYADKANIKRRGHAQDLKDRGNVWYIPYSTVTSKEEKFNHPASFPVGLPRNCILLSGKQVKTVCDPFCGSGSTGVAAISLGKQFTGIDIDKSYLKITKDRIRPLMNSKK